MRKCRYLLLCLLLLAGLIACSNETQPVEEEKIEPPVTVTVEPSHKEEEPRLPTGSEMMTEDKEGAAASQGGILDACGDRAAFLSQQGGIVLADLSEVGYHYLSSSTAAKLYYDGTQVYYTGDDGIFAIDAEGQTVQLSAHLSYALWVWQSGNFLTFLPDSRHHFPYRVIMSDFVRWLVTNWLAALAARQTLI